MGLLDKNKLLSEYQYSFMPRLSTEYAATILSDDKRRNVDNDQLVRAAFVDLNKVLILSAMPYCLTNLQFME